MKKFEKFSVFLPGRLKSIFSFQKNIYWEKTIFLKEPMKYTKLFFSLLLIIVLSFTFFSSLPSVYAQNADQNDSALKLYAKSAVLMDADSGRILYQKEGDQILPMASTTKIMTCILALEYGNMDDYAIASSYASSMPKVKLHVKAGETFKLKDLLYSLMLESHNDAAVVIAEHIAGSTENFADMMNQKARDIGCFDTYFITPNGLDATVTTEDGNVKSHSTTASDLARMMSYCIMDSPKKEAFLEITRAASYSFHSYQEKDGEYVSTGRNFNCNNHNAFLGMMEGALSGKTGFTGNAGYCYVGALRNGQRTFVVALLACGWPNHKSYKWSDTKNLMNYGLDHFEYHRIDEVLYDASTLKPIPVSGGQVDDLDSTAYTNVKIQRDDPLTDSSSSKGLLLRKNEQIQVEFQMEDELTAPVTANTEIGRIRYLVDGSPYLVEYILTAQDVPAINYPWCIRQVLKRFSIY